jgi:hypothetical protein
MLEYIIYRLLYWFLYIYGRIINSLYTIYITRSLPDEARRDGSILLFRFHGIRAYAPDLIGRRRFFLPRAVVSPLQ